MTASTASAKAMSVAVGIAQPLRASDPPPALTATYTSAGTSIPPTAAATGSAARRGSRRSPATISRLSSSPATKKKIASSPSAAQALSVRSRCSAAGPTTVSLSSSYDDEAAGVRPHQRDQRRDEQQRPADRLLPQDVADPARLGPRPAAEQRRRLRGSRGHGRPSGVAGRTADQTSRRTGEHATGMRTPRRRPAGPAAGSGRKVGHEHPVPRTDPPAASRTEVLVGYLDYFRSVVLAKVDGLSEDQLRGSVLPSGWSPLELVKHLTYVEMRWLEWGFEGRPVDDPWGDHDGERWQVTADESSGELTEALARRGERDRSDRPSPRPRRTRGARGAVGRRAAGHPRALPAAPDAGIRPAPGAPGRRPRADRRPHRRVLSSHRPSPGGNRADTRRD